MDIAGVRWLSFDCYGTLIDWERGILAAVGPVLARRGVKAADDRVLTLYADAERAVEAGPYLLYREVLARVMELITAALDVRLAPQEREVLARSVAEWPAFQDTPGALTSLQRRFKLAVLSNVDEDLFDSTRPRLGVALDAFISAENCRSYKPARANFEALLRRTGAQPSEIVHVAQSLFHDIAPASGLGLRTVHITRGRQGASGPPEGAMPRADLVCPDMQSLARLWG
jgi:2-haloacid dehalogenase